MLYLIQKLQVFFFFKKTPKNPCPHFRYSSSIYHLFSLQMHPYERMFNLWNDSLMKVLCRPFVGASLFTFTWGRRTGSSEKWQEESDLISKCKCRPFNRVPVWLQMPRMCGTNPQHLVCFRPHLPSAWYSSLHLPCLSCCTSVSNVLNVLLHIWLLCSYAVATPCPSLHQSPHRLLLTSIHPLIFQTVWLLTPSCPRFSLLLLFPLPPHSLSPSSIPPSIWWLYSLLHFPILSPVVAQTRTHCQGPNNHLHLCSKLHRTISEVTTLTLEEQRYYANKLRGWLTPQRQGCL